MTQRATFTGHDWRRTVREIAEYYGPYTITALEASAILTPAGRIAVELSPWHHRIVIPAADSLGIAYAIEESAR